MPTIKGQAAVSRYMGELPAKLRQNVLRGAARAAAKVVAEEAKDRSISSEVDAAIKVSAATLDEGHVVAKVQVKGEGAYIAPWLEYGTSPHFISVDDSQRRGMSVGKINRLAKEPDSNHSLVIGGRFVGSTVFHPGARPHPFLRPALDTKEGEAIAAAQSYITSKLARSGLAPAADEGDEA